MVWLLAGGGGHYLTRTYGNKLKKMGVSDAHLARMNGGTLNSNLFFGARWAFHKTVQFNFTEGKIPDEGLHIPSHKTLGHRFAALYYRNTTVGIAYLTKTPWFPCAAYRVLYVGERPHPTTKLAAFPNGYYPVQAEMWRTNNGGYTQETLFDRRYPQGFRGDVGAMAGIGHHSTWTQQQWQGGPNGFKRDNKKPFKITIRDTDADGKILDQMTTRWNQTFSDKEKGRFFRVGYNRWLSAPTMTIKPKNGIISGAVKYVLGTNKKKIFHITIEGGLTKHNGEPYTYRIIYYDIEHP